MRVLTFLEYTAIVVGVIAMIAGKTFFLPKGFHFGLFLVGAGFVLGGLESLFTRQMSFRFSSDSSEAYSGAPAVIWGLMVLLIGVTLIASAYVMEAGLWRTVVNHLTRRPGPALAALGLLCTGAGVLLMLNPRGRRGVWWTLLVRAPKVVMGLALVVAGLAGVGLGVWEWFEPRDFDRFSRDMWARFDLRAFDRFWRNIFGLRH